MAADEETRRESASKPSHPLRRHRRDPAAWGVDGEPGHPPFRRGDRSLPRPRQLGDLRAALQGSLARAVAAPSLHLAVLPRRSRVVRRRPSPVRRVPARELPRLPRGLGRSVRGRAPRREGAGPPAAWRADRPRQPPAAAPLHAVGAAPRRGVRGGGPDPGGRGRPAPGRLEPRGLWRTAATPPPRRGDAAHAPLDGGGPPGRLSRADRPGSLSTTTPRPTHLTAVGGRTAHRRPRALARASPAARTRTVALRAPGRAPPCSGSRRSRAPPAARS